MRIIIKVFYFVAFLLTGSCGQSSSGTEHLPGADSLHAKSRAEPLKEGLLATRSAKFLWRERRYDTVLKDTLNTIVINEALCKTLSDPERAALGYVVTFTGSDCDYDGQPRDDFSNLKCKALDALDLGYQCSGKHLGFLRQWFKNDSLALKELENCPRIPYTATIQNTFDFINLVVNNHTISVQFGINGVDMRAGKSWSRTETDQFDFDKDNIRLRKRAQSNIKQERF